MNRITYNLSKRRLLVIVFGVVIALYSLFIFIFFPYQIGKYSMKMMNAHAQTMADMAAINLGSAMYFEDSENIDQVVRKITKVNDVDEVAVFDVKDSLLLHSISGESSQKDDLTDSKSNISENSEYLVVSKTIVFNEQKIGKIVLTVSLKSIIEETHTSRKIITAISIIIFLLGLTAVFWATSLIRKPLTKLKDIFWRIAGGELSIRADVSSKDEFGSLAASFNKMVDQLEATQVELEGMNRNLEVKVELRTFELKREIDDKKLAEAQIQLLNKELEQRVDERTSQLQNALTELQNEISERMIIEQKLSFSDKVLRNVGAMVLVADSNAEIVYCSEYISVILGFLPDEILGKKWTVFYKDNPEEGLLREKYILEAVKGEGHTIAEPYRVKLTSKTGDTKWIQWQEMKGEANTVVFVGHDITNLVEAEEKLLKAKVEIETALEKEKELNELKTRFVSMISHEYRTPLTVILTSTSLLSRLYDMQDKESFERFLNKIVGSVDTMTKLLEDVLVIGRSDSGRLKKELEEIDIESCLQDSIDDTVQMYDKKQKFVLDNKAEGSIKLLTDKSLFKQIISNLLTNAAKYSDRETDIRITFNITDSYFEMSVADNGIGMGEDDLKRLYDTFHRGANVGAISGTGLGMSIVRQAVDSLHGDIRVHSELGKGSIFVVKLPVAV